MYKPLVSIIIPTYNRAHLIGETLDSVLAQTYTNWECIIVDDDSTDNTMAVVNSYCKRDSRFCYYKRPEYLLKGGNASRNYGFQISRGELIQFFDSDDVLLSDALKFKVEQFHEETEIVVCGFFKFRNDRSNRNYSSYNINLNKKKSLLNLYLSSEITLNTPSFMYLRAILMNINFDENLHQAQDLNFVFDVISKRSYRTKFVNKELVGVRVHKKSISGNTKSRVSKRNTSNLKVSKKIMKFCFANNLDYEYKNKFVVRHLLIIQEIISLRLFFAYNFEISKTNISIIDKLILIFWANTILLFNKGVYYYTKNAKRVTIKFNNNTK